jgi:hypothetical protein
LRPQAHPKKFDAERDYGQIEVSTVPLRLSFPASFLLGSTGSPGQKRKSDQNKTHPAEYNQLVILTARPMQ